MFGGMRLDEQVSTATFSTSSMILLRERDRGLEHRAKRWPIGQWSTTFSVRVLRDLLSERFSGALVRRILTSWSSLSWRCSSAYSCGTAVHVTTAGIGEWWGALIHPRRYLLDSVYRAFVEG